MLTASENYGTTNCTLYALDAETLEPLKTHVFPGELWDGCEVEVRCDESDAVYKVLRATRTAASSSNLCERIVVPHTRHTAGRTAQPRIQATTGFCVVARR